MCDYYFFFKTKSLYMSIHGWFEVGIEDCVVVSLNFMLRALNITMGRVICQLYETVFICLALIKWSLAIGQRDLVAKPTENYIKCALT